MGLTRALALLAIGLVALPARADRSTRTSGIGVIATADPTGGIPDSTAVASALTDAVAGSATRVVRDARATARAALATGHIPAETVAALRRVRDQIDEGWRAYLRVEIDIAELRLASALREAQALVVWRGGAELCADAALRLGVVHAHLGRRDDSHGLVALALALHPGRTITLAEFSPDVVELVAAVRQTKPPTRRMRVTTTPAGARVRIDGVDAGLSPVERDVPQGPHVIVAELSYHRSTSIGTTADDTAVSLTLPVDEAARQLAIDPAAALSTIEIQQLVDATMRYAELDEMVIAASIHRRGTPTLLVQRCANVPSRCTPLVELGYGSASGLAAAARDAWQSVRHAPLREPPSVLGARSDIVREARCRLCRNPWLWSGVGAVVALGAVLTVVALSSDRPPPTVVVDPGIFAPPR